MRTILTLICAQPAASMFSKADRSLPGDIHCSTFYEEVSSGRDSFGFRRFPAAAADPIRVLILAGQSDFSHPWQPTVPFMRDMLTSTNRFDVRVEEEVRGITADTLASYDVLLDYYYGPRLGGVTEKAIEDFVRGGKGMVGVHRVDYGPFFGQAGGNPQEPKRHMEGRPG